LIVIDGVTFSFRWLVIFPVTSIYTKYRYSYGVLRVSVRVRHRFLMADWPGAAQPMTSMGFLYDMMKFQRNCIYYLMIYVKIYKNTI